MRLILFTFRTDEGVSSLAFVNEELLADSSLHELVFDPSILQEHPRFAGDSTLKCLPFTEVRIITTITYSFSRL